MVKGNRILKKLGKVNFCIWLRKISKYGLGINLVVGNLVGVNLKGVNLVGANLRGANLVGVNLVGANLRGANLVGVNLVGANLRGANLVGANLVRANLRGANLVRANLVRANLRGANLDFSCLSLWCGSSNFQIDERLAKQIMSHALNICRKFYPHRLTQEEIDWLNDFYRIKTGEFPKFEMEK